MCVGSRRLHQCKKNTHRNLLCCPAALNHGGRHGLTDSVWSSVRDPEPKPRPQQPASPWEERGGASHSTRPRWATGSVSTAHTQLVSGCVVCIVTLCTTVASLSVLWLKPFERVILSWSPKAVYKPACVCVCEAQLSVSLGTSLPRLCDLHLCYTACSILSP